MLYLQNLALIFAIQSFGNGKMIKEIGILTVTTIVVLLRPLMLLVSFVVINKIFRQIASFDEIFLPTTFDEIFLPAPFDEIFLYTTFHEIFLSPPFDEIFFYF